MYWTFTSSRVVKGEDENEARTNLAQELADNEPPSPDRCVGCGAGDGPCTPERCRWAG